MLLTLFNKKLLDSAASTDAAVPSVGIFVAGALAVDVQDLDHWLAVLTS